MFLKTDNAQVSVYCRESGEQISFNCNNQFSYNDHNDLCLLFEKTMSTNEAVKLAYSFEMFHDSVNYYFVLFDYTEENNCLRKISDKLSRAGYDLYIDNISYE